MRGEDMGCLVTAAEVEEIARNPATGEAGDFGQVSPCGITITRE
jgi:hypothetical protein